jgi:hypothetical protein
MRMFWSEELDFFSIMLVWCPWFVRYWGVCI